MRVGVRVGDLYFSSRCWECWCISKEVNIARHVLIVVRRGGRLGKLHGTEYSVLLVALSVGELFNCTT